MEISRQLVFIGFVNGLSTGLLALGVILIYRSSRVINFAVGNIGALAATLLAYLVINEGWPLWLACAAAVLAGAAFAAATEVTVITRLFRAPRVVVLVATIGIAQLAQLFQTAIPKLDARLATRFPTPLSGSWEILGVRVEGAELLVIIVVPLLAVTLAVVLSRTDTGRAIRAASVDAELTRLMGVSPKVLSTLVWTIAGVLSSVSLVLLAGTDGSLVGLTTIGPSTLVRVLAAALIGSMRSFTRGLLAGVAIGIVEAVIRYNWPERVGLVEALLFLAVVAAAWRTSRRADGRDETSFSFAPRSTPMPQRLSAVAWVRALPWTSAALAIAVGLLLPVVATEASRQFLYSRVLLFALAALSLVVLTGWNGQVSLGQAAFAGLGALGTAALVRGQPIGIGIGSASVTLDLPELHFAVAVVVMGLVSAGLAILIGAGTLRVAGLMLAVVTLAFALAAQQYFWRRPFLSGGRGSTVSLPRAHLGPIDLSSQRNYYYLALAVTVLAALGVAHLRRTGVGRTMIAVRENADAAASYTIRPRRVQLTGFGIAGGLAGLAGGLLGGLYTTISYGEVFTVTESLQMVALAVIGGIGSVTGPVWGALWIIGLPAIWPDNDLVPLVTSSVGLLALLMYFPGGFVQLGLALRDTVLRRIERRLPAQAAASPADVIERSVTRARRHRAEPPPGPALVLEQVTVRFGARTAVDQVDLHVDRREVVGLIGTNGAGKTTLMNAVGGFVSAQGQVRLQGRDIAGLRPSERARLGLGRTFQAAKLFPQLTVRETLQVALEARHRTLLVPTLLLLPASRRADRAQRADAEELIAFLGLGPYGDHTIASLSTGTRRIVELAALLALDASVVCLDEPTAGVAQRETESFGPLLRRIRDELDCSMLVIEHDMPLIMSVSDRIYCLEAGKVIASGTPEEMRHDPKVVASYLGTDERAILRSGALPS